MSIIITQIYNFSRDQAKKEYVNLINNLYFQKTVNNIFQNLQPKFQNIEHKVIRNESLSSILKKYKIKDKEINLVLNKLSKEKKIGSIKTNQILKFTIRILII